MVTVSLDREKSSGYGRSEDEAVQNTLKNFFEALIDKDLLSPSLAQTLLQSKEGANRSKKPPKAKEPGSSLERSRLLPSQDPNRSRLNDSSQELPRQASPFGPMKTTSDLPEAERSISNYNNKSKTPDRSLYVHEPHDCQYR